MIELPRAWAIPAGFAPPPTDETGRGWLGARWQPAAVAAIAEHLAERGSAAVASVPIERRIAAWRSAVDAFLDPESDERRALLAPLVATSRLSPEGLTEALELVLGGGGGDVAERLAAQLPPPAPRALGGVVVAANVPALAVQSLLPALLVGRPLLVRSSAREPLFAPALVAALARREPALGDAFAAITWPNDESELWSAAFGRAERVLAYGGTSALGALTVVLGDRLVGLGPRASVALVAGQLDAVAEARRLARDVALLDQRGCLSVQAVWVEGGLHAARDFAEALAWGLAVESRRLPPGPPEPELAALVQQLRGEAALRDALIGRLEAREGSVLLSESERFVPVPGLRTVRVHAAPTLDLALDRLEPARGILQGAALSGDAALERGDEIAARLDLARVAPAGRLQHAEAGWRSGGVDPLVLFG